MNYIVMDLEWNQCPDGKEYSNAKLPFEIIEIGAVKLNQDREIIGQFHEIVKPQVYKWIHARTREVIHMNYKNLAGGKSFTTVAQDFLDWCGEEYCFCTWGSQDLTELQRNMRYYQILDQLPGPIRYYDVQKLFSIECEDGSSRRSLEYAIEFLKIEKKYQFHRAQEDACYTVEILRKLDDPRTYQYYSIDVYQNPKGKKEEIHIKYPTYDKYVSREFAAKDKVVRDREVNSTRCPVCGEAAKRKIRWFTTNSKQYYSVSVCQTHGLVKGKIRVKRTEKNRFYAVKTIKLIGAENAKKIQEKQESLRARRQLKRLKSRQTSPSLED